MKKELLYLFCIAFLAGCQSKPDKVEIAEQYMQYDLGAAQYAVVYVSTEKTSTQAAHDKALKQAAEMTKENGYRYFVVDSEQEVQTIYTMPPDASRQFHQNAYQEMIVEGDFGPNSTAAREMEQPTPQMYPGVKIVFSCFKEPHAKAIDACTMVSCD